MSSAEEVEAAAQQLNGYVSLFFIVCLIIVEIFCFSEFHFCVSCLKLSMVIAVCVCMSN